MTVRGLWRLWALLMTAAVLAGLALLQGSAQETPLVAPRQAARLPPLAPLPHLPDPAPALALLSQSTLWGPLAPRAGAAGAEAPPPPKWGLTGYYEIAGTRYVVVSFELPARASQQLKRGDKLPDGSRIEGIEPDRVRVRAPDAPKSVWLPVTPGLAPEPPKHKS
ncbi:MAG TPA: hypothetical protein PKB14_06220 [Rubrivivax sp.]|mgnify:CR=1 FL=1|nr:hypothetical protein [Rubrivivax sp.]